MTVTSLARRIGRLDRGISVEARALEKLTDAEFDALVQSQLTALDPALGERYAAAPTAEERFAILKEATEGFEK
jgi:hypothetical protein